ncbi:MAG: peptidoglycan DD-metalloendopeptidase family protein [Tannerella sp.]|jgi:septal ring factor EnvC (AmiA/AmiB activator)|nr:peptidoglycan DD-metalloendopeptidase family protein [Tannerella sp.]
MKRFYIVTILLCCIILFLPAQNRKSGSGNSSGKKTTSSKNTNTQTIKKTQEMQIPTGLFSAQELERQRKEALKDIELTSQLLNETSANAKTSLNRLNLLSQQLLSRKKIISILGQEMAEIDQKIKAISNDIEILDKDLAKTKENYAKSMQSQQQEHRTTQYKMLLILSAENLSQSYRRMRYLREYSDWQKEEADRIVKKQGEITRRKTELENSRKEKQDLLTQRENENKKLEEEEQLQQKEVRELNKKQKDLQRLLDQKRKEANALNKQIENLIAEDIKNSEKNKPVETAGTKPTETSPETTSKPAATPSSSAKGNYILTESEVHLSKDFAGNKGKLPYPLTGKYTIVSTFGEHQHQELSHVRTNNNGIDIQTTTGAEARAIFKGVVTRVFVMPGFNNNVIIRHGNYLTVYSNLSEVYVKAGDIVATRQSIGKIFTDTEKGNETILHFQIWQERTKLNPVPWIK